MKLPLDWMREFVPAPDDPSAVAARLASCGFEVASVDGAVIDFEITANRPDCLSVYGLAREASTAFDLDLKPAAAGVDRSGPAAIPVSIGDAGCGRYAVALADVKVAASPAWLADRLTAFIDEHRVPKAAYEFSMLYGIQRPLQQRLVAAGRPLRVLVAYGEYWVPWYMRRLAERPANVMFVVKNLFR